MPSTGLGGIGGEVLRDEQTVNSAFYLLNIAIACPVFNTGCCETCTPDTAGVAHAARTTRFVGLIAGYGETVIDAERQTGAYDVFLGQVDQRRVDGDPVAFNRGFGGEVRQSFKRVDEFGAAVGVAGIVDGVDAGEYVAAMQCLGPCQRE